MTAPRPSTRLAFAGTAYLLVVLLIGSNMPTALYASYREAFGFSPVVQTVIFAVYVVGLIPSLLVFGPLSDRIGRRPVLATSVLVGALASVVLLVAPGTAVLAIGRLLQGVAVGAITAAGAAALLDYEPHRDPSRAAVTATLTTAIGAAFGPLFAASIAEYLPYPLTLPYVVYLIVLAPAVLALLVMPNNPGGRAGALIQLPRVPAPIRATFWRCSLACAVAWGAIGLFQSVGPSWISGLLGTDNLVIASSAAALSLLAATFAQIVSTRFAAARSQTIGLVALAVGMVGLFVVNAVPSLAMLLAVAVTTGVGHGFAFAGSMRELNAAAFTHAPREQGAVIAAMFTVGYLGLAVPSLIAGMAATLQGMSAAIFETAAVGVVLCAALVVVGVRAELDSGRAERIVVPAE